MLSLVFWMSLAVVFLGLRWLADGLMSLARVQVRAIQPGGILVQPAKWREDHAPVSLNEAA